jgi:hypothetical protein
VSLTKKARLGWLALPLVGLVELVALVVQSARAPAFEDWRLTEPLVRELGEPGDLVVVAPHWAEPIVRRVLPREAMPLRDVARSDERGYAHVLEVSLRGARAPGFEGYRELGRREAGPFVVRRLASPAPTPVRYDFVDQASPPSLEVFVRALGMPAPELVDVDDGLVAPVASVTPCKWTTRAPIMVGGLAGHPTFPARRFECPGGPFFHVSETVIADERYLPRRCLFAHPPHRGEVVLRYRDVPLGDVIVGRSGLYWIVERSRAGAPITLDVRVDGALVGSVVHEDGQGFAPFELPLGAHGQKSTATVELSVHADDVRHRHFCFEARAL